MFFFFWWYFRQEKAQRGRPGETLLKSTREKDEKKREEKEREVQGRDLFMFLFGVMGRGGKERFFFLQFFSFLLFDFKKRKFFLMLVYLYKFIFFDIFAFFSF